MAFSARVPANGAVYTKRYAGFAGVDLAADPTQIDSKRSPSALNVIAQEGVLQKRTGWKTVLSLGARINGLFCLQTEGENCIFAHAGSKLYHVQLYSPYTVTCIREGLYDGRSAHFVFDKRLWILTGREYLVVQMKNNLPTVKKVDETAYIPTTSFSRHPNGTGGVSLESANMLNPLAINSFLADGVSVSYKLDSYGVENTVKVLVDGEILRAGEDYTVDRVVGRVVFVEPPPVPIVLGVDTVVITYTKILENSKEKINGCSVVSRFGDGGDQRFFFCGNKAYPNCDWHSGFADPSYIPVDSLTCVGSDQSEIMGYLRVGDQQAVLKSSAADDSSIFLRSPVKGVDGKMSFAMTAGISGAGAASKYMMVSLRDDPLFLTQNGIFAVASASITKERSLEHRSRKIDPLLTVGNLSDYVGVEWGNYLLVCDGNHCFVADARQKTAGIAGFEYEWYLWDNIPARVFLELDDLMYFGSSTGRIGFFKSRFGEKQKYSDDTTPIASYWSSKLDDDGDFSARKALVKDGIRVLLAKNMGAQIYVQTDDNKRVLVGSFRAEPDTASTHALAGVQYTYRTAGYKFSQIVVENNALNEGFGIYEIVKKYRVLGGI